MTAQLVHLNDYRPPIPGVAHLYLNAMLHIWLGLAMLATANLKLAMRGRP